MRRVTVDYLRDRDESSPGTLLNRGIFLHGVTRLMLLCRLRGHRPVVDGTDIAGDRGTGTRWVVCDRCGVRPEPQGRLDPGEHEIGTAYAGPYGPALPDDPQIRRASIGRLKASFHPPGPWPDRPTGELGMQVVLGRSFGGLGVGVTLGAAGNDHVLDAHLRLHHLVSLYVHSQHHGRWLQRRLIPEGYDSRVVEVEIGDGRLRWRLWAKRDEWAVGTPRWQDGSVVIDPREWVLGPVFHSYTDVGPTVPAVVRMPHGDDHQVGLQLQRRCTGRSRGRKTHAWTVDWDCDAGIPVRRHDWKGDSIHSSHVDVSDTAVREQTWPMEAVAHIAEQMTRARTRHDYRHEQPVS